MALFKFLPPERLDFFDTQSLRYSPPAEFNDPFEAKPHYTGLAPAEQWARTYPRRFARVLREQYLAMSPNFKVETPYEVFAEALEYTRAEVYEIFRTVDASFVPLVNDMMHTRFREQLGVLSLSEANDGQLMWSHYADSHRGFVIEFDTSHSYFSERHVVEDDVWQLRKIRYAEQRPHTTVLELDLEAILLTKHNCWAYEREWKDFQPLNRASSVIYRKPFPIHLFKIPPTAIRAVFFGANMMPQLKTETATKLRTASPWSHMRIAAAGLDYHGYAVSFHDIE